MTWVRIDDNFHWHPKVSPLSSDAYRLCIGALCYCNRFKSGGLIRQVDLPEISRNVRRQGKAITELVGAGLWEEVAGGWCIHDYAEYQPDPIRQAAGRKGGKANAEANALARAQAEVEHGAQPPSRPVPPRPAKEDESNLRTADGSSIAGRGWRGGEEGVGEVLARFSMPSREAIG